MDPRQNGGGPGYGQGQMSRAERFEEEKRRIVDSCFNKKDVDGSCELSPCHIFILNAICLSFRDSLADLTVYDL